MSKPKRAETEEKVLEKDAAEQFSHFTVTESSTAVVRWLESEASWGTSRQGGVQEKFPDLGN